MLSAISLREFRYMCSCFVNTECDFNVLVLLYFQKYNTATCGKESVIDMYAHF